MVPVKNLPGIGHSIKEKIMNELKNSSNSEPLVQDLLPFSKQKLMHIFGDKTGTKLFNYARGKDDTSIKIDLNNSESVLGRKSVSVDVNFGIRFDTVTQLETFLIDLSKELYSRLVGLGICGSSLTLRLAKRADNAPVEPEKYLGMGVCDYFNKTSRLGVPTNDWGIIGNELKALYRMLNIPVKELRGIAVTMSKLRDVAMLKKDRQMRLPFSAIGKNDDMDIGKNNEMNIGNVVEASPIKEVKQITSAIQAQPTTHSMDRLTYDTIDWEVFKEIPEDIKRELKRELSRRGMQNSPIKKSPVKREAANSKVFLQQLLPTQDNGSVKYARVVHASKSPTKKRKASKSPLPIKKESSPGKYITDLSTSYDESVLNELPSSVKAEVLKDLQYKRKVKRMNLAPTRERIKNEELTVTNKITQSWVNQQTAFLQPPLFLNQQFSYNEIVAKIKGWIRMTFNQQGPHSDDIGIFRSYLAELLYQHNLNRCLNLMNVLQTELDCHSRVISMNKHFTPEEREFKTACINDWKAYLANDLKNVILQYCIKNSIEIDV
ncbi:hypothetical protein QCA50_017906 [Cerrena zonata]|uniref:DNA repair protein REV1 n=1 Tax=Cerrena zonata TaxID=2478898 RepID=A0AAW0FJL5_9APHY